MSICGGRGRHSRKTPDELRAYADHLSLNGDSLVRSSRLAARIDNNAVGDGFQLYLHAFIVTTHGEWAIVQQGMNPNTATARRYHWHSVTIRDFTCEPHTGIAGEHQGVIVNLVDKQAKPSQSAMLEVVRQSPDTTLQQVQRLMMPHRHDVHPSDVDLRRLGSILAVAYEREFRDFASLLLLEKLGPRTLQSLALVAEVVHGTPIRFSDPARFSFAHGGKDGHPFPVPLQTYDETVTILRRALESAKLGHTERVDGIRRLDHFVRGVEQSTAPTTNFRQIVYRERTISKSLSGKSVFDAAMPLVPKRKLKQLSLF